jgi:ParB/RepB/Spo0J family partition protein
MSLKDQMKNLDIMTARRPSEEQEKPRARNLMTGIINQAGEDLKSKIRNLEAELARYREHEEAGRVEVAIPIDSIERPDIVMRSAHYWRTERYRSIKESIRQHGLQEPITVRPSDRPDRYILVKGDTRLNTHRELLQETGDQAWGTIRARVEPLSDENAILMMLIENRDREDVCAYDQAVFYRRVLDELLDGDRQAVMSLLDISEGWLSKNLSVSAIPVSLMEAYPVLYHAGIGSLYPLSKSVETHANQLVDLLEQAEALTETSPARQASRLQRVMENKSRRPAQTAAVQAVTTSDGKVLAEVKQSRQYHSLRIDNRAMPGFAEFVEKRLADLHAEWQAHQAGPQSDETKAT